ncbi:hypothetical protein O0L34_g8407 [Tuta absoluta]|nr:hypothetical protein O0L34_g8407 [Tuta absoluta]
MERLIKMVRKHPCLWDVNHVDYRDNRPKDEAWELVAKECGMKNGFEAKFHWKKLRDSHREALRRRRIKPTVTKPWKYEEQMRFILGEQNEMSTESVIEFHDSYNDEETFVNEINMVYDDNTESPYSSPSHIEADSKVNIHKQVQNHVQQDELRDVDASIASQQQQDALATLFDSLCQKTRVLPKHLQLRVQREVFEAVLRAEEEALSFDPLGTIQSSCSLNRASSYGPSSSTK